MVPNHYKKIYSLALIRKWNSLTESNDNNELIIDKYKNK